MKKLKIVFSTNNDKRNFSGREDEALGGAWYSYLSLAKELAKYGHRVYSFHNTPDDNPEGTMIDGVKMVHRKWLKEFLKNGHTDIYIGEREMPIVRKNYDISVVCYHLHNTPLAEHPGQFIEWLKIDSVDKIIFVSQWHRKLAKLLPDENCYVIPNGTHIYPVKGQKKKNRIIWASNPTRGLSVLAGKIFPLLQKKIPNIELRVAGSFEIYNNNPGEANRKNQISYDYLNEMKGVKYLGGLNQKQLAQFYHEGTLLVYPLTNRSETGSIVAVQSMAYGTPVIVLDDCVFPELIGESEKRGLLVPKNKLHDAEGWVSVIEHFLKDKKFYKAKQNNCMKWRDKYLWQEICKTVNKDFQEWCA